MKICLGGMKYCWSVLGFIFMVTSWAGELRAVAAPESAGRREAILHMLRQDCGSCHGLTMKGGLGPALLPAALAEKDVDQMVYVILNGRRGTPMPPWRDFLDEAEARWVVDQLRRGLPGAP